RACSRSQPSPVSQNNSLCSRRRTYGSHFFFILPLPPSSTLFPYTTLFRSRDQRPCTRRYCRLPQVRCCGPSGCTRLAAIHVEDRSEEHTSELQSRFDLVCRLLLEKKKENHQINPIKIDLLYSAHSIIELNV